MSLSSILRETRWFYHKYSILTYVSHYAPQRRQANKIKVVIFNLYQPRESRTEGGMGSGILRAQRKLIHRIAAVKHFTTNDCSSTRTNLRQLPYTSSPFAYFLGEEYIGW